MLKNLFSKPFAHRGLHDRRACPENSMAAFSAAIEHGYSIDLDVRPLADLSAAVFHDDRLERLTGQPGVVEQTSRRKIKQFQLFGTEERIPYLEEVLELVDGAVAMLVEIKNFSLVGEFEQRVRDQLVDYDGEFAIQSFNPKSIAWFRNNEPAFTRGLLCLEFNSISPRWLDECEPHYIGCEWDRLPADPLGFPILAGTVRSESELAHVRMRAEGIVFEEFLPKLQLPDGNDSGD